MPPISKIIRKKLGDILVDEGILKDDQVQEALRRQRVTGEFLGEALIQMGYLTEMEIARSMVKQFVLPYIDASRYRIPKEVLDFAPTELMWQNQFVVLDKIGKTLILAVAGVLNAEVFEKLEKLTQAQIFIFVATSSQVQAALEKNFSGNGKSGPKK